MTIVLISDDATKQLILQLSTILNKSQRKPGQGDHHGTLRNHEHANHFVPCTLCSRLFLFCSALANVVTLFSVLTALRSPP